MKTMAQGAEAVIKRNGDSVLKQRIAKDYRLAEIDEKLRKSRTRREAKVLQKLSDIGFPCPKIKNVDDREMVLEMDFLEGRQVKDVLHENPDGFAGEIGRNVGLMHANGIVHSDLTTSNMLLHNGRIHFIDFGLGFFSEKVEDRATDLHLLGRALESGHYEIYEQAVGAALAGYRETAPDAEKVLDWLEQKVRLRGRHKRKIK